MTKAADGAGGGIEPPPPRHGRARVAKRMHERGGGAAPPPGFFFDPAAKVGDTEQFRVAARLLARESHHVCDIAGVNDPSLTQNVRLLREAPPDSASSWDPACCLRGAGTGSRVPGSRPAASKKH